MQKNIFFGNFFFTKKTDFRVFFRLFKASVQSWPPGPPAFPGVFLWFSQIKIPMDDEITHMIEDSLYYRRCTIELSTSQM